MTQCHALPQKRTDELPDACLLASILDILETAVIVVDGRGRVIHASRSSAAFLVMPSERNHAVEGLLTYDPTAARHLRDAIGRAAAPSPGACAPSIGMIIPGHLPYGTEILVWVAPLRTHLGGQTEKPDCAKVAIFVRPLAGAYLAPPAPMVERYNITSAEARVLADLINGSNPGEIAAGLGISITTIKTHMSRLFDKTATRRQADLIRLAMRALAPIVTKERGAQPGGR